MCPKGKQCLSFKIGVFTIKTKHKLSIGISIVIVVIGVALGGLAWYQAKHFNANVTINGVKVGGLDAKEALAKLKTITIDNNVYVGEDLIYHGQTTKAGFTTKDLAKVQTALKKQFSFFPNKAKKNLTVVPTKASDYRQTTLKQEVQLALEKANQTRQKAIDAYAWIQDGKVQVVDAKKGNQYDVAKILQQYSKISSTKSLRLKKVFLQPIGAKDKSISEQKESLEKLLQRQVTYEVQTTPYVFKAEELLNGTKYQNSKYQIQTDGIEDKIAQINASQATLGKSFVFKTTDGNVINVQGETYGWAIDKQAATQSIVKALENDVSQINAKEDIYGKGYLTYGTGYDVLSNDGIGDTYVEVSLAQQRLWIYKNGQQILTCTGVTGNVATNEQTPTGVYYIMYKQSPSVLKGVHSDGEHYEIEVKYWAQFTNSGCGFHDATWRTNWDKDAYLIDGSGGCFNLSLEDAQKVYDAVFQKEPVIVY